MSITMNGQSRVPPGFRFHPTEEELLNYYLRKKVASEKIDLDVIRDVDLNKLEPWDIQDKCRIGSTPQNDWYFFSHKDKKYPTGTRTNRATAAGFWKATGRDKVIYTSLKRVGMRKTLVFYKGRAPHGQKSDWIMHEYRLEEHIPDNIPQSNVSVGEVMLQGQEDGWVVCRVFKKKNYHKSLVGPSKSSSIRNDGNTQILHSGDDRTLDQILRYIGRSCQPESSINHPNTIKPDNFFDNSSSSTSTTTTTTNNNHNHNNYMKYLLPIEICASSNNGLLEKFTKLPALESPSFSNVHPPQLDRSGYNDPISDGVQLGHATNVESNSNPYHQQTDPSLHDWATLDHLVASHLNVQLDVSKQLTACFDDTGYEPFCSSTANRMSNPPHDYNHGGGDNGDMDLWGAFTAGSVSSSG